VTKVGSYVMLVLRNMKPSIVGKNKGSPNLTTIQLYLMLVLIIVMIEP